MPLFLNLVHMGHGAPCPRSNRLLIAPETFWGAGERQDRATRGDIAGQDDADIIDAQFSTGLAILHAHIRFLDRAIDHTKHGVRRIHVGCRTYRREDELILAVAVHAVRRADIDDGEDDNRAGGGLR